MTTAAADPEYIAHHRGLPQCKHMDRTGRWRCSRVAGHTQTWHHCWSLDGHTLATWETP